MDRGDVPNAWLIRAGKHGEDEDFNLDRGLATVGWNELPDLRSVSSLVEMKRLVREADPDANERSVSVQANQLWSRRTDQVNRPHRGTRQVESGGVGQRVDETGVDERRAARPPR